MRFSFWFELRGPARLWAASIVFTVVGVFLVFGFSRFFTMGDQDAFPLLSVRIFGSVFLVLGLIVLAPMLASLFVVPVDRAAWHWWANFIGGLLGALTFAVPATLMFPIFLLAYLVRPNILFPVDSVDTTKNLGIAALFSLIGLVTLIATIVLARLKLRQDPKRED